jgi:hypothetical protein
MKFIKTYKKITQGYIIFKFIKKLDFIKKVYLESYIEFWELSGE